MVLYRRVVKALEVKSHDNTHVSAINEDTRPLPPERRTFGPWEFVTLWVITGKLSVLALAKSPRDEKLDD